MRLSPNISLDDAKAQAAMHGFRITAASVNAAKTLLSKMDAPAAAAPAATAAPTPPPPRTPRRQRQPQAPLVAEAMIRGFVERMNADRNAEVERLKDAVRKAIAALQVVLG